MTHYIPKYLTFAVLKYNVIIVFIGKYDTVHMYTRTYVFTTTFPPPPRFTGHTIRQFRPVCAGHSDCQPAGHVAPGTPVLARPLSGGRAGERAAGQRAADRDHQQAQGQTAQVLAEQLHGRVFDFGQRRRGPEETARLRDGRQLRVLRVRHRQFYGMRRRQTIFTMIMVYVHNNANQ